MTVKKFKINVTVETSFTHPITEKQKKKAQKAIKKWAKETLEDERVLIPFYIEEDKDSAVVDLSEPPKIKVKRKKNNYFFHSIGR